METINVLFEKNECNSYSIFVGSGVIRKLAEDIKGLPLRACIIADNNTERLFGKNILGAIGGKSANAGMISFLAGEMQKTRETKAAIEDSMIGQGFGRDTVIVALGGGVVGDLAGFVASTYNRGVPFVQVPTTLLAAVDSSIGGKTGVNTIHGKNLIGAFWQPRAVYVDVGFIKTLPDGELSNGLAEVIKYAMIKDSGFFDFLEKNMKRILKREPGIIEDVIVGSIRIKVSVVVQDEKESQLRKSLNYGHTIGHAIEQLSSYRLSHGQAVAIGMAVESSISENMGLLKKNERERQNSLLMMAGLPVKVPEGISAEDIISKARLDKKARQGVAEYALIRRIGELASSSVRVDAGAVRAAIGENR